eukprot:COSAG02_NODE_25214_length_665_cov_1.614841_1_plen_81_part_10
MNPVNRFHQLSNHQPPPERGGTEIRRIPIHAEKRQRRNVATRRTDGSEPNGGAPYYQYYIVQLCGAEQRLQRTRYRLAALP